MHRIALIYQGCLTRNVLALWLRAAGYRVDLLPVDDLGTLLADTERPDLILFDYDLPDRRGPDVLGSLRNMEHLQGVPIVALSANSPPAGCSSDGALASAWLAKPCDIGELAVWLVRLLGPPLAHYTSS